MTVTAGPLMTVEDLCGGLSVCGATSLGMSGRLQSRAMLLPVDQDEGPWPRFIRLITPVSLPSCPARTGAP